MSEPKQEQCNSQCVKENVFIYAAKYGGFNEVCISKTIEEDFYTVSVLIKQMNEWFTLSTRRDSHKPREFKHVDVAISKIRKMIGATKFIITYQHPL